jgi:hypothetical protein
VPAYSRPDIHIRLEKWLKVLLLGYGKEGYRKAIGHL